MTFVQNQEITMTENVGYTTELITAQYKDYKGLNHTMSPAGVNVCMSCSLLVLDLEMTVFL